MFLRLRNRLELGALSRPASEAPKAKLSVMSMFRRLISSFDLPPSPPASTEADQDRLARATVAERSHGNIPLQLGDYYTKEDLDKETNVVLSLDFSPSPKDRGACD